MIFNNVESTDTDTDTYNLSLKLGWDAQGTLWPQMNPEMLKKIILIPKSPTQGDFMKNRSI
jgi:hypothetical protein